MTMEAELIPDLGFRVSSGRLDQLFEESGAALTNLIVDVHTVLRKESKSIDLFAPTLDELMHNWLVEITYLYDYCRFVVAEFVVEIIHDEAGELRLHATLSGESVDVKRHSIRSQVKLILVNNHKIEQREDGSWNAEICVNI